MVINRFQYIDKYFNQKAQVYPLAFFRFVFGALLFISIIRFWANGWIQKLYIEPSFHFSYYGFHWIKPIGEATYFIFAICGASALAICIGWKYRYAIIIFFLSFTYIELMDKTTYLNHYYFVSVMSAMLIFLPANRWFSIDAYLSPSIATTQVPKYTIDAIKVMLSIVYFYAGLAKLNSDWLLHAQPLSIWLSSKGNFPIIGSLLTQKITAFVFSYFGVIYDLTIPFLLWNKRTRKFAFFLVVVFHLATRLLFPIGMFPFIMIGASFIFFEPSVHKKWIQLLAPKQIQTTVNKKFRWRKWPAVVLAVILLIQSIIPFRYLAYPGELFWTEEGFRFSWRVMLMDKVGYANFKIVNPETGNSFYVQNSEYLTPFQEKQMAFQPDFILEYAHYLASIYNQQLNTTVEVYVESYVSLNGRGSKQYIDPSVNLAEIKQSLTPKHWVLPFNDEIKGF